MIKLFEKLTSLFTVVAKTGLALLCVGIIAQLLLGEKLLGWDPVGHIQSAGSAFTGVLVIVLLYQLYKDKNKD